MLFIILKKTSTGWRQAPGTSGYTSFAYAQEILANRAIYQEKRKGVTFAVVKVMQDIKT